MSWNKALKYFKADEGDEDYRFVGKELEGF